MPMTRPQIAQKLKVNPNTLRNRLTEAGIKPSGYVKVKGREAPTFRAVFDASTFKEIQKLFKNQPVAKKRGWPKGRKRKP